MSEDHENEPHSEDWWTVAEAIRARRSTLGLTQQDLATASRLGIQTIRNIEAGRSGDRRGATLHAIENALKWPHGVIQELGRSERSAVPPEIEARLRMVEDAVTTLTDDLERLVDHLSAAWEKSKKK